MKPITPLKHPIIQLLVILNCLILCRCVTEYNAKGIDELTDILVVSGIITDDETTITLSRSTNISKEYADSNYVDNAKVYVECDDGTKWEAEPLKWDWLSSIAPARNGRYTIKNGKLNLDNKYRLKIEIKETDGDNCVNNPWMGITCPTKTYEYCSEFSYPFETPEIDSIFYVKRGKRQPVMIYVDTRSPESKTYYRWSYKEDWEVNAELYLEGYPFNCWNSSKNSDLLVGTAEKTVYGQLADILTEIDPADTRLSALYRIIVKQNVISKKSHDYYLNIKKNAENIGSIFAPIPSELRGNIICTTEPERPVIGYIDVSGTTQNQRFILRNSYLYEPPPKEDCEETTEDAFKEKYGRYAELQDYGYILYRAATDREPARYIFQRCVDCRKLGGITQKPDNWPR